MKHYYIPTHAHTKAIAHHKRTHGTATYPLDERNGTHGGLVRTLDRKQSVQGLRVYFTRHESGQISPLRFERTY